MNLQRLSFLILTLSFFQPQMTAQELVREGAQWNVFAYYWSFPPSEETICIKIEGDTLINDISYKKLHESYDSLNLFWTQTDEYIREDSARKIYLLREVGEILLYDFNLVVGDTFWISGVNSWDDCNFLEVIEMDTVELFNGDMRTRWKLENPGGSPFGIITHWTEGIGCSSGLIRYLTEQYGCWEHYPYSLLCHYYDGEIIHSSNQGEYCWRNFTSIEELNQTADGIAVYPNPTTDLVVIESEQADRKIEKVDLYSTTGELLSTSFTDAITETLNLSEYKSGVYYAVVTDDSGRARSVKLIKTD